MLTFAKSKQHRGRVTRVQWTVNSTEKKIAKVYRRNDRSKYMKKVRKRKRAKSSIYIPPISYPFQVVCQASTVKQSISMRWHCEGMFHQLGCGQDKTAQRLNRASAACYIKQTWKVLACAVSGKPCTLLWSLVCCMHAVVERNFQVEVGWKTGSAAKTESKQCKCQALCPHEKKCFDMEHSQISNNVLTLSISVI